MSIIVGRVGLGVDLESNPFDRQLNALAKKAASTLAAAFSVKKLVDFGKSCIEMGSDLAEVQNVVDVTFGKLTGKVDEFAKSAAMQFGLSETMAKKYIGTFGSMAEAFGFSEKQAFEMSKTLTGLAGDVASFYNISQDEAYTKLKSVFSGETETLKDLGIVMTQSALDAYAMANGFGKVTKKMTEQEKVSLRYAFVQSQLTNATGDFYRTQDSWANQSRILALQAESAMAAVGQGLINLLRPALVWVNAVMGKVVQLANAFKELTASLFGSGGALSGVTDTAKQLGSSMSGIGKSVAGIGDGLNSAKKSLSNLGGEAKKAGAKVGKTHKAIKALRRELEGFDQITRLEDKSKSSGTGDKTKKSKKKKKKDDALDGMTTAARSTASSTEEVAKASERLKKLLAPLVASLGRLKAAFSAFVDTVKKGGKWVLDHVLIPLGEWTISKALPGLIDVLASAFYALNEACKALAPVAEALWDCFLQPIASWTGGVIVSVLKALRDVLTGLGDWIRKHQALFDTIAVSVLGFVAAVKTAKTITKVIEGVKTAFEGFRNAISIFRFLKEGMGTLKAFKNAFSGFSIVSKVTGLFAGLNPVVLIVVGAIGAAVAIGVALYKNWDKICAWAGKLRDKLIALKDKAFGALGNAVKKVNGFFKKHGDTILKLLGPFGLLVKAGIAVYKNWDKIKAAAGKLWKTIKAKVIDVFQKASDKVSALKEAGANIVKNIKNGITEKAKGIGDWFNENVIQRMSDAASKAEEVVVGIKAEIQTKKEELEEKWGELTANIKEKVVDLKARAATTASNVKSWWGDVTAYWKDKGADLSARAATAASSIRSWWNDRVSNWRNKVASLSAKAATAASTVRGWWNGVAKYWKDKKAKFSISIASKISDLKSWFNKSVIRPLNNKIHKIPFLGGVSIPYLAQGGYVRKNTPQLAMIGDNRHQGEVVAPEDKLEEMARKAALAAGGGNTQRVEALLMEVIALLKTMPLYQLDQESLRQYFIRKTNANTRANNGRCELTV